MSLGLIFILLVGNIVVLGATAKARAIYNPTVPETINVPEDAPTIQSAINIAYSGDVIAVAPGIYYENVVINKTISLLGADAETTIIDGGTGAAVQVTMDNVTIDGFTIRNGGIELMGASGNIISGNDITGEILMIYAFGNIISGNDITGEITMEFLSGNIISGNDITGEITMDRSSGISIYGNNVTGYIWMNYAGDIGISGNNITEGGISFSALCININIYHNNFINSQAGGLISGILDDGYPSGGNYWSDYAGVDVESGPNQDQPGSDGIGDTPYIIDTYNTDNFPLMDPWINSDPVVGYVHVWGYPGGLLDPGGSIQRGQRVRVYAGVSDLETASDLLDVTISYRVEGDDWTSVPSTWQSNYGGYWYYDWTIPADVLAGLYDVMVEVDDGDGGSAVVTELGEFNVLSVNSDPVVNYVHVWGYPGGLLDPGGSIQRGQRVRMYAGVSDLETASDLLDVTISYRVEGDDWTSVSAVWLSSYGGYWYVDWVISGGASAGLYNVMVNASDGDGGSAVVTELGEFTVANSDPVVGYVHVWGYPGGLLDAAGSINTGQRVRIYAGITDAEMASDLLDVTISYRSQGGSWTNVTAVWLSSYGGYWYVDWGIPGDATAGLYDVMVEVSDGDGGSASVTELGEFTVNP